MTGLIVNKDQAPDVRSINDLFDPKYKGRVECWASCVKRFPC